MTVKKTKNHLTQKYKQNYLKFKETQCISKKNLPIDKMHTTSLFVHDRMGFSVKYYLQIHNTCISGRAHVDIYVLCMISRMSWSSSKWACLQKAAHQYENICLIICSYGKSSKHKNKLFKIRFLGDPFHERNLHTLSKIKSSVSPLSFTLVTLYAL